MDNMLSGLSGNQRLLVIGIAGFVIGVALTTLFFVAGGMGATVVVEQNPIVAEEDDDRGVGDGSARVGNAISRGNDRVSADDQPAGSIVKLASVSLATSSWVAIHEDVAGNPGNILGAVRLDQGASQTQITLLRPTEPGRLYYVRIYRDNDDREFDPASDQLLVNVANIPIGDIFQTE